MILARWKYVWVGGALACCAVQAHADVLEIGAEGARWIAGPQAALPPSSSDTARLKSGGGEYLPSGIPPQYAAKVAELSTRYDLSPSLIEALVWQESRWRADAVSPKGARGLAQLMPGTARYLGVDSADPLANLEGGARYLREQLDRFDGDLEKALAAYNAGPGRVERAQGIPPIRETRQYVTAIMGRLSARSQAQE